MGPPSVTISNRCARPSGWSTPRPFGRPEAVLAYLSRYTHRVAISNHRLLEANQSGVTFRYKDYRIDGPGRYKTMTLPTHEFIRRFLMHVLPKGFHRIRHYGLFANGNRAANLARARELLHVAPPQRHRDRGDGCRERAARRTMPLLWRPHARHRDLRPRLRAKAPAATRTTARPEGHLMMPPTKLPKGHCLRPSLVHRQPRHQALRADRSAADGACQVTARRSRLSFGRTRASSCIGRATTHAVATRRHRPPHRPQIPIELRYHRGCLTPRDFVPCALCRTPAVRAANTCLAARVDKPAQKQTWALPRTTCRL